VKLAAAAQLARRQKAALNLFVSARNIERRNGEM
jgi:hypothetical protein